MAQKDMIDNQSGQQHAFRPRASARPEYRLRRHRWPVRLMHWINLVCMTVLFMSGLQIFNAHPALYWGHDSNFEHPWLSINAQRGANGDLVGVTRLGSMRLHTTGVLGTSGGNAQQGPNVRAFPSWATLPGPQWLAMGRQWHFFFAWLLLINGCTYIFYTLAVRHLERDLLPDRKQLCQIGHAIKEHVLLRFPQGDEARRYNVLQKLSYLFVIFVLGPLVVLTGLTMSPWMDSAVPQLLCLFGGRQSARAIHFICTFSLLAFVIVHVFMVLLSGAWNNMRSMITGLYVIEGRATEREQSDD